MAHIVLSSFMVVSCQKEQVSSNCEHFKQYHRHDVKHQISTRLMRHSHHLLWFQIGEEQACPLSAQIISQPEKYTMNSPPYNLNLLSFFHQTMWDRIFRKRIHTIVPRTVRCYVIVSIEVNKGATYVMRNFCLF